MVKIQWLKGLIDQYPHIWKLKWFNGKKVFIGKYRIRVHQTVKLSGKKKKLYLIEKKLLTIILGIGKAESNGSYLYIFQINLPCMY